MQKITDVVIFGIGAAGSRTFIHLLYPMPALNYTVVDFDKVESRNVEPGTQVYARSDINRFKTQALQRIAMQERRKKINVVNKRITSTQDIIDIIPNPESTLIVDAFDNAESRNLFIGLSSEYNVIHIGFSAGLTGEAVWNDVFSPMESSKADGSIDVCEQTDAKMFIERLASYAAQSIKRFIEQGKRRNLFHQFEPPNEKHWDS